MEKLSWFECISVIYKSRFVLRSDAEYREILGASFETVSNKQESVRDLEMYYSALNKVASQYCNEPLSKCIDDYVEASEVYESLEWGDRTQLASRKKFCRLLFRLYATGGKAMSGDEAFRFKIKGSDEGLLNLFFPDGYEESTVNICFMLLFAFGIIRPWRADSFRGRDIRDKETKESLESLRDLISLLQDDTPRLGSVEKPLVFNQWIELIDEALANPAQLDSWAPLRLYVALIDILVACRSLVKSERKRELSERSFCPRMPGIWIDDTDEGRSRFWIFPVNIEAAFCYRLDGVAWVLDTFEFSVKEGFSDDVMPFFVLLRGRGNLDNTLTGRAIEADEFANGNIDVEFDEETGEPTTVLFYEAAWKFPAWFDMQSLKRLSQDDSRYREFRAVLREIYNPQSPHSVIFRNTAATLTDAVNNMVGKDNMYIYVFDWRPKRFVIRKHADGYFYYQGDNEDYATFRALFDHPVSEKNPLYAIPKEVKMMNYGNPDLDRLAELLTDAENIDHIVVLHSSSVRHPRLVFPNYGLAIALDMDNLAQLGVRKFTKNPFGD